MVAAENKVEGKPWKTAYVHQEHVQAWAREVVDTKTFLSNDVQIAVNSSTYQSHTIYMAVALRVASGHAATFHVACTGARLVEKCTCLSHARLGIAREVLLFLFSR